MASPAVFVCPDCNVRLASEEEREGHRRSSHGGPVPPPSVTDPGARVAKIRCSVCEAAFDRPEDWMAHSLSPHRLGRESRRGGAAAGGAAPPG